MQRVSSEEGKFLVHAIKFLGFAPPPAVDNDRSQNLNASRSYAVDNNLEI